MKKYVFLGLCMALLAACSDGDLQIGTIDFDGVPVAFCDVIDPASETVLFKINGDESLILVLQRGVLDQDAENDTITTESSIPGQSQLTYRVFSGETNESYFCEAIPPATPSVLEEIKAENGLVTIETVFDDESNTLVHTISLSDVSLVNAEGERLTDTTSNTFGQVTTAVATD